MKRITILAVCFILIGAAHSQEKRIDVTSFEDDYNWQYTGGSIQVSLVETSPLIDVTPKDGDSALYVEYDNAGTSWQWSQLNFSPMLPRSMRRV